MLFSSRANWPWCFGNPKQKPGWCVIPPQLQVGEFVISVASSCDGNVACAGGRVQAWGEDGKSYEAADVAAHVLHSLATVLPVTFDVLALAIEMAGRMASGGGTPTKKCNGFARNLPKRPNAIPKRITSAGGGSGKSKAAGMVRTICSFVSIHSQQRGSIKWSEYLLCSRLRRSSAAFCRHLLSVAAGSAYASGSDMAGQTVAIVSSLSEGWCPGTKSVTLSLTAALACRVAYCRSVASWGPFGWSRSCRAAVSDGPRPK